MKDVYDLFTVLSLPHTFLKFLCFLADLYILWGEKKYLKADSICFFRYVLRIS